MKNPIKLSRSIAGVAVIFVLAFNAQASEIPGMPSQKAEAAPPIPSVEDRVRNAELIAFISVTNVAISSYTNSAGQMVKVLTGDTVIERLLKGKQPKLLKVKQEIVGDHSASIQLSEGKFLARLNPSGSFYIPCDYHGLGWVVSFGTESGDDDRVLWPECNSVAEAVTAIEQALKNTPQAAE